MGYRRHYRPNNGYRRRSQRRSTNINVGEGLGHVAATGFVAAVKTGIKVQRVLRTAGRAARFGYRAARFPFKAARGVYRAFRG